jgi:hypothetical protein
MASELTISRKDRLAFVKIKPFLSLLFVLLFLPFPIASANAGTIFPPEYRHHRTPRIGGYPIHLAATLNYLHASNHTINAN